MAAVQAVLLDTCAVIWIATGALISRSSRIAIDDAANRAAIYVSPISAWEIGRLAADSKSRLEFDPEPIAWFERFLRLPGMRLTPFTPEVAIYASFLPGGVHGDPADRFLIATARRIRVPLVTRDHRILSYAAAGHVRAIKC